MSLKARIKVPLVRVLYRFPSLCPSRLRRAVLNRVNRTGKRYIRPEIPVADFFRTLHARGVDYVVLRWFEELPEVRPGKDIDLLVADEDVGKIADLLTDWPLGTQVDVFSATGLPGYSYRPWFVPPERFDGMALFPPHLAAALLGSSRLHKGTIRVPDDLHYFLSLAYHAAYLKTPKAGLRSEICPALPVEHASHDYALSLERLAEQAGVTVRRPVTLEALDEALAQHGWRPPQDVLDRVSAWNPWVATRFGQRNMRRGDDSPGLAVFVIRQRAVTTGAKERVIAEIEKEGFERLAVVDLEAEESARLSRTMRGGNWGKGPWKVSGGPPACLVVVYDPAPVSPADERPPNSPYLDNLRITAAKAAARDAVNRDLDESARYNAVHSTDSSPEAWAIIRSFRPKLEQGIRRAVAEFRTEEASGDNVVRSLSRCGSRCKIELIQILDNLAVKKTFRASDLDQMRREAEFLEAFSDRGDVPAILERGKTYFVTHYFDGRFPKRGRPRSFPRFLPLGQARSLASFLRRVAEAGYDLERFSPHENVLLRTDGQIKVVDVSAYRRRNTPLDPENLACFQPESGETGASGYSEAWLPVTGLGLRSFLYDPPWLQAGKRIVNWGQMAGVWFTGKAVSLPGFRLPPVMGRMRTHG